jgi:hypothetical protein
MAQAATMLSFKQRRSTVKIFFAYVVMLFVVLASIPAHAQLLPMVLYDDFDTGNLDPTKWVGSEVGGQGREAFRSIKSHQLRLGYIGYCDTDVDSNDCASSLRLNFTDPNAVTAIQAVINPAQVATTACASNPFPTSAGVELFGFFFNTGTPQPGSNKHDVRARIGVERTSDSTDPADTLRVSARVVRCLNDDCSNGTELYVQDMGPITIGTATTLTMQWDPSHDQFIFQRDDGLGNPQTFFAPYNFSDASAPGVANKRIHATVDVPSCTTNPRPSALIQAFIDDVSVNAP